MANYLPGMLEVPIIDGQSEDICGRDDRYYHFGMWTDFCDISINQLKLYNQFPNNPKEDGYPYQPSEGVDIITYTVNGNEIQFTSPVPVESYLTFTIKYDYTDEDGNIQHGVATGKMKKWDTESGIVYIDLPAGITKYDITKVDVSPERDAWYYYRLKRHKPHIDTDKAFRFGLVSTLASDSSLLNADFVDSLVQGDFMSGDTIMMQISIGENVVDSDERVVFKTYKKLEPVDGLNDMDDESAEEAIINKAVDIIFAVDTDIEEWDITDALGLQVNTSTNSFREIGQVIYDGETYRILRYKNQENLSLAYDPKYAGITRSFIINFTKKQ